MYGAFAIQLAADLQRPKRAAVLLDPPRQIPVQRLHVSDDLRLFIVVERKRATRAAWGDLKLLQNPAISKLGSAGMAMATTHIDRANGECDRSDGDGLLPLPII